MAATDDLTIRASSEALLRSQAVRKKASTAQFLRWILLFAGGLLMVMPLAYMISTSLKWPWEVYEIGLIPQEPTLEN